MTGALSLLKGDGTDRSTDSTRALIYPHADGTWYTKDGATGLEVPLAGVATTRQIIAGAGLTGGGSLAADRTLNVASAGGTLTVSADSVEVTYGSTASTAAQGNDSRIVNAVPNTRSVIAGNGLTGGGTLSGDVTITGQADGTTLEIAADAFQIKDLGVGTAKLAANAADNTKIAQGPALTLKGNATGSTANEQDLTVAQATTLLTGGVVPQRRGQSTVTGSITIQLLTPASGWYTIPANTLQAGDILEIWVGGFLSTTAAAGNSLLSMRGIAGAGTPVGGTDYSREQRFYPATLKTGQAAWWNGILSISTAGAGGTAIGSVSSGGAFWDIATTVGTANQSNQTLLALDTTQAFSFALCLTNSVTTLTGATNMGFMRKIAGTALTL